MKTAKNGGTKSAQTRAEQIKSETKKLVKIAQETDSELETRRDAYRAYSAALHRAVNEGRVWRPDIIARLYPIILELNDELEMIELEEAYFEAKDRLDGLRQQIKARVRCSK